MTQYAVKNRTPIKQRK